MREADQRHNLTQGADGVLGSPLRTLAGTLLYVGAIFMIATLLYAHAGWSLGDAAYMVLLSIFSVGFENVRPIDTAYLRGVTAFVIVFGCTGMIVLTGALVQVFTLFQVRRLLGIDRMQSEIAALTNHVIICGYGRIGVQLAHELQTTNCAFVIIERSAAKAAEAAAHGHLTITGEATEEETLYQAGVARARVLATVLPDDAANVFITLSARNLNPALEIIARGEAPSTESKLFHAGASKVVLPTHIGAERIVELILYPETDEMVIESEKMNDLKRRLRELGLDLEVVTSPAKGAMTGETVGDVEQRGKGAFFITRIDRANGQSIARPGENVRIEGGDTILLVVRGSRIGVGAIFTKPAVRKRSGRGYY
jgi:voltage-gated potassium channel